MTRGLLDMPEDVMGKIIKDIGIKAIMTLRKVCSDLRNFIDDVKPDVNLEEISIHMRTKNFITVCYEFSGGEIHDVVYNKHTEGCLVKSNHQRKGVLLKNEDFITVSMKDFEIVSGRKKSVLKQFSLSRYLRESMDEMLLENLLRILKSRQPLKAETFQVAQMDQYQIMSILPLLDSKTLKTLEIQNLEDCMEVDQLVKLDHWRNIKHIFLQGKYLTSRFTKPL